MAETGKTLKWALDKKNPRIVLLPQQGQYFDVTIECREGTVDGLWTVNDCYSGGDAKSGQLIRKIVHPNGLTFTCSQMIVSLPDTADHGHGHGPSASGTYTIVPHVGPLPQ